MDSQRYIPRCLQELGQEALGYSVIGIVGVVMELSWDRIFSRSKVECLQVLVVRWVDVKTWQ